MVQLNARSNFRRWSRGMTRIERQQVPFATALALTRTVQDVKRNTEKTLPRRLDRPTPFTQRGMTIIRATKTRPIASALFKRIQAEYLGLTETGGTRRPKGRALVLPAGLRLNKHGNIPKGAIRRLLARPDTFSGAVGGVAGIWQRTRGGALKLMVAYERRARYKPQLRFGSSAIKTATARLPINWRRSIARALRTAR